VVIEQLGSEAAELLSLTKAGAARSLSRLAEMAAWQVPGCSGATAVVWYDREVLSYTATHPDLAELAEFQLRTGAGPLLAAAETGLPVSCPDTLRETRWPRCGPRPAMGGQNEKRPHRGSDFFLLPARNARVGANH